MRGEGSLAAGGIGALLAAVLGLGLIVGLRGDPGEPVEPGLSMPETQASIEARALAFGQLIDVPRPLAVIDEGLRVADSLRHRYGIDTGDLEKDRRLAAERARVEFLEKLAFPEERLETIARALGYSLDPASCADYCDHVRRLAVLEASKSALSEWASTSGKPGTPITTTQQ